jgi:hypothetical protein
MLVHECVAAFKAQPHGKAAAQAKNSSAVPTDRHSDIPYATGTLGWQVLPTAVAAAAAVSDAAVTVCEQLLLFSNCSKIQANVMLECARACRNECVQVTCRVIVPESVNGSCAATGTRRNTKMSEVYENNSKRYRSLPTPSHL